MREWQNWLQEFQLPFIRTQIKKRPGLCQIYFLWSSRNRTYERKFLYRFYFSSYYNAKQHIEKYMHWYNNIRRHGLLGGITPAEKWAQGLACSPVKQTFWADCPCPSRLDDTFEKYTVNHPHGSSRFNRDDGRGQSAYLCLTGEQAEGGLILSRFEKSVQLLGG